MDGIATDLTPPAPHPGRRSEDMMVNKLYDTIHGVSQQVAALVALSEASQANLQRLEDTQSKLAKSQGHLESQLSSHMKHEEEERRKQAEAMLKQAMALESHRSLLAQQTTMLAEMSEKVDSLAEIKDAFHVGQDGKIDAAFHRACMETRKTELETRKEDVKNIRAGLVKWGTGALLTAMLGAAGMWFDARIREVHKADEDKTAAMQQQLSAQQDQNKAILEMLSNFQAKGKTK